jgi:putative membrane protein
MFVSALVSALHILGVGLGLGSIYSRARALGRADLVAALRADTAWGLAFLVLLGSGLARAFAGLEKGAEFYLNSPGFHGKMALLAAILLLELWPMAQLMRWRFAPGTRDDADPRPLAWVSWLELTLLIAMLVAAAVMTRGLGYAWFA